MGTLFIIIEITAAVATVAIAVGAPLTGMYLEHRDTRRAAALRAAHESIARREVVEPAEAALASA